MSDFNLAVDKDIALEGTEFTDCPGDHGGCTKFGLTLGFIQNVVNSSFTVEELEDMTRSQAVEIYKTYWWDKFSLTSVINQALAEKVFESIVNLGPTHAIRLVQKAINDCVKPIHIDGLFGPQTLEILNAGKAPVILVHLKANLVNYYKGIVARDPSQHKFLKGWLNRANA